MKKQLPAPVEIKCSSFHLPRYHEITNVGLYLEQVVRYVNSYLAPLGVQPITSNMVSNYVKQKTIPHPIKKCYDQECLAYLMFVSIVKTSLPMEDIRFMIQLQKKNYDLITAYDYFCDEFENILDIVFGYKPVTDLTAPSTSQEKELLRNTIITVSRQIYLHQYLIHMHETLNLEAEIIRK